MAGLLQWWIKNPIAANLSMITLIVAGLVSYFYGVEKEPFPAEKLSIMDVSMRWQGAGPREIEDQIVVRFEDAVKNVEGIKHIVSRAVEGRAAITIFGDERIDRRRFADDIREKINSVNGLPSGADRPVVTERTNRSEMIRIALHGSLSREQLAELAYKIRQEVAKLPLISNVVLRGQGYEEVTIEITEQAMSAFGIGIGEVVAAIRNTSINAATGTVRDEAGVLLLSVRNRAEYQQEFEDIVVRQQPDGAQLRLKDIAHVRDGLAETHYVATFDGETAVLIDVMNTDYMNIPKMSAYVHDYVTQKQAQLPSGVSLTLWSDWNDAYQSRLKTILGNAASGLALVFLLLILFLQPKIALWVSVGIATAFAASFALLPAMDVSLNMMSLFAFLMVIGIVVDDAIVVGESVHLANEAGHHGDKAAFLGVSTVAKPVVFGVLTTIVVFLPMVFLPGKNAEFTRAIAVVVILSLAFSLFDALFILPSHLRHLSHGETGAKSRLARCQATFASGLSWLCRTAYMPFVRRCFKRRFSVLALFLGGWLIGYKLLDAHYIEQSFMPMIADDKIQLEVTLPPTTTIERMQQVFMQVKQAQQQLVEYAQTQGSGQLIDHDYTQMWGGRIVSSIKLVDYRERAMDIESASLKLQALIGEIPDAEEIQLKSTLNTKEPRIGFSFRSDDIEALKVAINDFKIALSGYDGIVLLRDNLDRGSQEMVFSLKPGAATLGLTLRDVTTQIKQAYFGQEVQRLPRAGGDVRVKVLYSKQERDSVDTLQNFKIRTRDGRELPLLSVVNIELQPGIQRIVRRDGAKQGYVYGEYLGSDREALMQDIRKNVVPSWSRRHPEVLFGNGDSRRDQDEFTQTIILLEGLALLVAYMLMAIAFRSYMQPLVVLSAVPFAFVGAVFGHLLHGTSYGMFSMLGILAASGVVINDNVVLLDAYNRYRATGQSVKQAMMHACQQRFRPIVLTSLTTFIGLIPMLSAQSVQAKFLIPMVVSLAYGVLAATIVTLVFVPCLVWSGYDVATVWRSWRQRLWAA